MILPTSSTSAAGSMRKEVRKRLIQIGGALWYFDATNARHSAPMDSIATEQTNSGVLSDNDTSQPSSAIMELKRLSGLTWEHLSQLFGVARRSLHFWASGKPLNTFNEERLLRLLATLRQINRGDPINNRKLLCSVQDDGLIPIDLLMEGKYDEVIKRFGQTTTPKYPSLTPLSHQATSIRTPAKPNEIVGALQDPIHIKKGRSRPVRRKSVKKKP